MVTPPEARKGTGITKYEMLKSGAVPDYTNVAYREAVSRLRYLLHESYVPSQPSLPVKYSVGGLKSEESDEESGNSPLATDRTRAARLSPFRRPYLPQRILKKPQQSISSIRSYGDDIPETFNQLSGPPELITFIERQEDYIDQLEKEAQYCRDELSQLLGKVKDLISENETLQEQQKSGLMKIMFDGRTDEERLSEFQNPEKYRKQLEGPLIVFESRISELEAQLTQSKMDLRKSQEEVEMYKRKLEDSQPSSSNYDFYKQIENLQREKRDLNESLAKLQASINQIREKEIDASKKVQRTLDVVDKTQFEKQQAEMEVYRLKSELELQHDKLLEVISEQTRKVADERSQAERRYLQHVERLNADLAAQRDAVSKAQMEIEKRTRIEEDLKRDLAAKTMTIDSVKKELNNKIVSLQKELAIALSERDSLEQELNSSRMSSERVERMNKQDTNRLQIEISALKKRLDGGDAELIHCRKENLRLMEKISDLEKELTLYKIKLGEQRDPIEDEEEKAREQLLNSRISGIEAKHVERVSELEGLIENQSQVMAQLKAECQSLTQKLEESTARHKKEMENLQSNLNSLNNRMESSFDTRQWPSDHTVKESDNIAVEYQALSEEKKSVDTTENVINYNQKFLEEEIKSNGTTPSETDYKNGIKEQPLQSPPSTKLDSFGSYSNSVEKYEGNGKSQTPYFNNQIENISNIYTHEQNLPSYQGQPPAVQEQQYQPHLGYQDNQPFQGHQSFQDQYKEQQQYVQQEQPQYQQQQMQFQDQSLYQQQQNFQDQQHFQDPSLYQHQKLQEQPFQVQSSYQKQVVQQEPQPLQKSLPYEEQQHYPDTPLLQEQEGQSYDSEQTNHQDQKVIEESYDTFSEMPSVSMHSQQLDTQPNEATVTVPPTMERIPSDTLPHTEPKKPLERIPSEIKMSYENKVPPDRPPTDTKAPPETRSSQEKLPSDSKPSKPSIETPKSTQRFQRAAELSRQSSKSDENSRTKTATQMRRSATTSRTQQKPQSSRFK